MAPTRPVPAHSRKLYPASGYISLLFIAVYTYLANSLKIDIKEEEPEYYLQNLVLQALALVNWIFHMILHLIPQVTFTLLTQETTAFKYLPLILD